MKFYYTIILSFISFGNLYSQNKIACYGSVFFNWVEFSFYDNGTYVHTVQKRRGLGKQITKGKYTTSGDTIVLLDKIQFTYKHGNRSSKFLKSGDTLLIDLDILYGYVKFDYLKGLKQKAKEMSTEAEREVFWRRYFSNVHEIKFPYKPFENEAQKKLVRSILEDFFQNQLINTFFETDSVILTHFFYELEMDKLGLSVPHKFINFMKPLEAKTTGAKKIEFHLFYILEDQETVFFYITLYGKRRSGIVESYVVEYKKEDGVWKLNYIKETKKGRAFF